MEQFGRSFSKCLAYSVAVHQAGLSNAVGQDMTTNTGRKERSLDARVKFVIDAFDSMPRADYVSTLAQDIQTFDQ